MPVPSTPIARPPTSVAPLCAMASIPRANPLTIVGPFAASSLLMRSAICVPYSVGRRVPTIPIPGAFSIDASPRTYSSTGGS
jgi:hypothetical protein